MQLKSTERTNGASIASELAQRGLCCRLEHGPYSAAQISKIAGAVNSLLEVAQNENGLDYPFKHHPSVNYTFSRHEVGERVYSDNLETLMSALNPRQLEQWFNSRVFARAQSFRSYQLNVMTPGQLSERHNHVDLGIDYFSVLMIEPAEQGGDFYTVDGLSQQRLESSLRAGDIITGSAEVFHGCDRVEQGRKVTIAFEWKERPLS